jgi:hypothetical protein
MVGLLLAAWALGSRDASAQSSQSSDDFKKAQALFEEGSRLVNAGRYQEACPKLESAQRVVVGIGVTLYLGECYEQTGRLKNAWDQFNRAEALATATSDRRARIAHEHAERLWPRLAKIKIVVAPGADVPGLVITDEGAQVERSLWGAERPVDPATHHIRAEAPRREPWEVSVDVSAGAAAVALQVPPLREAASPPPGTNVGTNLGTNEPASKTTGPAPEQPLPSTSPAQGIGGQRVVALAVVGVGVVGLGLGALFGIEAKSKYDDTNANGSCQPNNHCNAAGLAERSDAVTAATISTVGFIVGALGLTGGTVLYLTAPDRGGRSMALVPRSERGGASLLVEGRW